MANGTTTESDVKRSMESMSKELESVFKKIQSDFYNIFKGIDSATDGLTDGFKNATNEIKNLTSYADRYNAYTSLSRVIQDKINELKSKSGYLDILSIQFKEQELELQKKITTAQISRILKTTALDAVAKKEVIDTLKTKMILADAELDFLKNISNGNNEVIEKLKKQLEEIQKQSPELLKQKGIIGSIKNKWTEIKNESPVLAFIFGRIWAAFTGIEDAAFEVRKSLGLIGEQGEKFKTLITDTYVRFANLGVTAENVGKAITGISNVLGSSVLASSKMVETFSLLDTSLGIASETSAKVLKMFAGISKSSVESQISMAGFTQSLSEAAGVPFPKVMDDLANLAENVRLTFRGTTSELVKSTVEARRMGMTINDIANVAEKLLNFQESINAEIEASVMMGKNISFNDARVLAYRGEIAAATKSVLDTVKKTVDLNNVDYFTLKSIAEATGLNVSQLQDGLQLRKDVQAVTRLGTDEARKQYALYESLNKASESATKSAGEDALERLKSTNNLALQKQLQTEFNGLIIQLGQDLLPVFRYFVGFVRKLTEANNWIRENLGGWAQWTAGILVAVSAISLLNLKWGSFFGTMLSKLPVIGNLLTGAGLLGGGGAGGAGKLGRGAMFSGIGSFMQSLGTGVALIGAATAIFILGKAISTFPTEMGGVDIAKFLIGLTVGLGIFIAGLVGLGALMPTIEPFLISAGIVIATLSVILWLFGKSLQSIADPIKIFSDSFSKLVDNINTDNLSKMKEGVVAVKEAMTELRGELQKFSKDDLGVLEKLGNLKANISAGIEGGEVKGKESANTAMAETIKSAVVEGMRQVKINISLDGKAVGTGTAAALAFSQPASAYTIGTQQGAFV